jgi:hypothetical protein
MLGFWQIHEQQRFTIIWGLWDLQAPASVSRADFARKPDVVGMLLAVAALFLGTLG